MVKKCSKCGETKDMSCFSKKSTTKDGFKSSCKTCDKIYWKQHYQDNKQKYIDKAKKEKQENKLKFLEYKKTLKCEICGETRYWCLDFHHIDPLSKDNEVSNLIIDGKLSKALSEAQKCIILCANCHRDLHYKEKTKNN